MSWRRILDLVAVCLAGTGLWAIAVLLWPLFGPVGIVVVLLATVLAANVVDYALAALHRRSAGEAGGPPTQLSL